MSISEDMLALIKANREIAAEAAARAVQVEANAERRHQERLAWERTLHEAWKAVMLGLPPDPATDPIKVPLPPVDLVQSQAERYLATFLSEFARVGISTWMQAAQHWHDYGRKEWLAGDANRRKFTP